MEEEDVAARPNWASFLLKALALGVVSALVALFLNGPEAAFGVFLGVAGGAVYVWGYLRSHMARAGREQMMDTSLLASATLRFVLLAVFGVGVYLISRDAFIGFLVGFALSFGVLLISEVPRVTRHLRARGMIG